MREMVILIAIEYNNTDTIIIKYVKLQVSLIVLLTFYHQYATIPLSVPVCVPRL